MKPFYLLRWSIPVMALVLFLAGPAFGQGMRDRMKNRLPVLIELKAAGIIGETSQGFVAFVGTEKKEQAVVDAENSDRCQVYEAIAKQKNTTPELVGQRRALQLAERAKPGEWLQNADGKWRQK